MKRKKYSPLRDLYMISYGVYELKKKMPHSDVQSIVDTLFENVRLKRLLYLTSKYRGVPEK